MSSRDYIVKQIEQMTSMLAVVLGLKQQQKPQQAETTIDEFLKRQYGLSLRLLRSLPAAELIRMCDTRDLTGKEKLYTLASLLKEDAELQDMQLRQNEAYASREKALLMLLAYQEAADAGDAVQAIASIDELLDKLRAYEWPVDVAQGVAVYYERIGRYDKAEDVRFELLERLWGQGDAKAAEIAADGLAFCERLLKLDDQALIDGNLPRDEIVDAARELQVYRKM